MNKLICLIAGGFVALSSAECLEWTPEARKGFEEAKRSMQEHRLPSPGLLEAPVNQQWVEYVRKDALEGGPWCVLFLNLGDPEVMRRCLESFPADPDRLHGLSNFIIQPKIISGIAGDFYRDEPSARDYPLSISACYITAEIIKNAPVFSEELKKWAREAASDLPGNDDPPRRRRGEMRVWWKENRTLFEAERYAEVKPPSTWTPEVDSAEMKKPASNSAQSAAPPSGGTTSPVTMPKATPTSAVAELPKSESTSTLPWMVGIALVLVILGVGVTMRRKV